MAETMRNPKPLRLYVEGEEAMVALGNAIGRIVRHGVIFLAGDLGAGKTTLCRGILRARGHHGAVKSPTFTLVEPYDLDDGRLFHFDLYRLGDPEELEYMGIRDYLEPDSLCLIEWPEKGEGLLPDPDWQIAILVEGRGRGVVIMPQTDYGQSALARLRAEADLGGPLC